MAFPAVFSLANLDGTNGFRIDGIDAGDYSGRSVSAAGDINGDGFADFIIGAFGADVGTDSAAGESYVVFGKAAGFTASFDLSTLDGTNGFRLDGIDAFDNSGRSVSSAGDINGDGFDDFIIGARFADPGGDSYAGESYVVFGKAGGFTASFDLSTLDGTNGFTINGIDAIDQSGFSVASAGDVNGDGFDDIIIGAYGGDAGGDAASGESYVVFGKAGGFTANLDLSALDGTNGFRLDGIDVGDYAGHSVSSAGDINGDGFDDIIIGAYRGDAGGDANAGESYVVFGKAGGFAAALDLSTLNGTTGFRIDGIDAGDQAGISVTSAGDINGDGFDDMIIGAWLADPGGDISAGESYIVFGKAGGFAASLDLASLNGTNGFRLDGIDRGDASGFSVASAGDFNGDGFDDFIVSAYNGDPGSDSSAGETYLVFGKAGGFAATLDLASLNGSNGFRIEGIDVSDQSGISVAGAGDVNGDGFDDIIIGAPGGDPGTDSAAGESYILFGAASIADPFQGTAGDDTTNGTNGGDRIFGRNGNDTLNGQAGDDNLYGGNGNDTLSGGDGVDRLFGSSGEDKINGGAGNDILVGGAGRDTLNGGAGSDRFIYTQVSDSLAAGSQRDFILGFERGSDKIDLSRIDAIPGGTDNAFAVVTAFTGTAGQIVLDHNGAVARASIDTDGDGAGDMLIAIKSSVALTASDFIL